VNKYAADRGIQASAVAAVTIGTLAIVTDQYRPVWLALGIAWVAVTGFAIWSAHRKTAD
jgi:lysozyme family protein